MTDVAAIPNDTVGARIRKARQTIGMGAAELGRLATRRIGRKNSISESAVRNQENGTNGVPLEVLKAYAEVLGTPIQEFIYGHDPQRLLVANRVKAARQRLFSTAAEAARALEVSPVTLRAHESGQNAISTFDLERYARRYGVNAAALLCGTIPDAVGVSAAKTDEMATIRSDDLKGRVMKAVQDCLDERGWSATRLAREAMVATSTVTRALDPETPYVPSAVTINKLSRFMANADVFEQILEGSSTESPLQIRLRERIEALGLNPYRTAIASGIGQDNVRDILRGKVKNPSAKTIEALAETLECSTRYLLGLSDDLSDADGDHEAIALAVIARARTDLRAFINGDTTLTSLRVLLATLDGCYGPGVTLASG